MSLSLLLALTSPASAQGLEPVEKTLPGDIPELEILAASGQVRVVRDPQATKSTVIATPLNEIEGCEVVFEGSREQATVRVSRTEERSPRRCRTDFEVVLAGAETALHVEVGTGRVEVSGTVNPVAVDLRAGRVITEDVAGPLDVYVAAGRVLGSVRSHDVKVYVGAGKVDLVDLVTPVEAEVGFGRLALTYSAMPDGRVWARTGVGGVDVAFPYGSWLSTTLDPGVGRVQSEIPFSDDAYTHLEVSTRVGGIDIDTVLDQGGADLATSVTDTGAE
jgi:hypothetical protein